MNLSANENDKNLLWDGLNITKTRVVCQKNPQNMGVPSPYVRTPSRQQAWEAKQSFSGIC